MLGLLFEPENGDDMFLSNEGLFQTTQHYNPENNTLQSPL
jgi:hypothetical protein